MQNPFLDAGQDYLKPLEQITQLQMAAGERLLKSQTSLIGELFNQSLHYSQACIGKTTADDWMKAQQAFFSDVGDKIRHATEDSMGVWSDTQEKIIAIMQSSMPEVPSVLDLKMVPVAVPKPEVAQKPAEMSGNKKPAAGASAAKKTAGAKKTTKKASEKVKDDAEAIVAKSEAAAKS